MALDIKQHAPVERPITRSGRAGTSELPALVEEVKPLLAEAMQLPADRALPVVVPTEQATDLVRALRIAGTEADVTVRFKRHQRYAEDGEQVFMVNKKTGRTVAVTDPFEYTNKAKTNVRVTFWTAKKIVRKSKDN